MSKLKKNLIRICLLLLYISFVYSSKHNCIHNEILKTRSPLAEEEVDDLEVHRRLQTSLTRPIKIVFDSSNVVGATAQQIDFIVNQMAPVGAEFFRLRLKVITAGSPLKFGANYCNLVRKFSIILLKKKWINFYPKIFF